MSFRLEDDWIANGHPRRFAGWLPGLVVLSLVVAAGTLIYFFKFGANRPPARSLDDVTAIESRFTLETDDHGNLTRVDRQTSPEVWYRMTLNNAPMGTQLSLHCDWIDPGGRVVHQNRYHTRVIDKEVWPTHARYRFGPGSAVGKWTVRLLLEDRVLGSAVLEVRDGDQKAELEPILENVGDQ